MTDEFPTDRIPQRTRAYIYRVLLALLPVLTVAGVLTGATAPLVIALVAAVLGVGQATAYTSTEQK
jgi:hypothetical protein